MLDHLRNRFLLLSDALLLTGTPLVAYAIRFEGLGWAPTDTHAALLYTALSFPLKLGIFLAVGLYGRLWRHASVADMAKIMQAAAASGAACALLGILALPGTGITAVRVPISVVSLDAFLTVSVLALPRLLLKALGTRRLRRHLEGAKRALIVGAGAAGEMILKELRANPELGLSPVGFVDDDSNKHNQRLSDLPVLGPLTEIREIVAQEQIGEIVIAMPTAPGTVVRNVVQAAMDAGVPARTVPGLFEILSGRVGVSSLRKVEIKDLLRREPIETDLEAVRALVAGHAVLVTGAGGSIGSELARQLARLEPDRLVLLGNGENEIFDILHELEESHPKLDLPAVIGDVRDLTRIHSVFKRFRPHVVFHAAAHKHVPLMEENAADAVTNNVLGTRHVVDCAVEWDTNHIVLISTDKAVRPTSVMGASKRVAEIVVQDAAIRHRRNFVSVRFGNVLASRCSVVPIFLDQIEAGGPVTVTHPEMRRFFMTIPEAVQLVLQAAALGRGGEVFVLDMGEPIKIVDLASDLIRLSGLDVGTDIEIQFTGVRPGERLHEEMFFRGEDVVPTEHPKILRATNHHLDTDAPRRIDRLISAAQECRADDELRQRLQWLVPEFIQPAHVWRDGRQPAFFELRSGHDRRGGERRVRAVVAIAERRARNERRSGSDRRCAESRIDTTATLETRAAAIAE